MDLGSETQACHGRGQPAKNVEKYREEARDRYLANDELIRLADALTATETIGLTYSVDEAGPRAKHAPKPENRRRKIEGCAVAAIPLLMLTGARCSTPSGSASTSIGA